MHDKNSDQPSPRDRQLRIHSKDNEVGFSTKNTIVTSCPATGGAATNTKSRYNKNWVGRPSFCHTLTCYYSCCAAQRPIKGSGGNLYLKKVEPMY